MSEPTLGERVAGSARLANGQRVARALLRLLGDVQVSGLSYLPASGPVLLAVNHRSLLDGPLVFGHIPRPVACLVKSEAFVPLIGAVLHAVGQIEVTRRRADPAAIRLCLGLLRAGGVVGIFPEGSRGDGAVTRVRPGVGYLALRSGATVLPVACHGTYEAVRTLQRVPVRLTVGAPLHFQRYPDARPLNRRRIAAAAEQVRGALAALVVATAPRASERVGR